MSELPAYAKALFQRKNEREKLVSSTNISYSPINLRSPTKKDNNSSLSIYEIQDEIVELKEVIFELRKENRELKSQNRILKIENNELKNSSILKSENSKPLFEELKLKLKEAEKKLASGESKVSILEKEIAAKNVQLFAKDKHISHLKSQIDALKGEDIPVASSNSVNAVQYCDESTRWDDGSSEIQSYETNEITDILSNLTLQKEKLEKALNTIPPRGKLAKGYLLQKEENEKELQMINKKITHLKLELKRRNSR